MRVSGLTAVKKRNFKITVREFVKMTIQPRGAHGYCVKTETLG
jgi:hypothetical protein